MQTAISKKILLVFSVLIFTTSVAQAAIFPSDVTDYEVMATGNNYTAYFSQFDTNGFTYVISDHRFSFLPRKLLYTDDTGTPTLILGHSNFAQLQNTTDIVYYDNPYGLENQLQYLSNPLMVKEVHVMNSLPTPPNLEDWLTMSSIAINDDLELNYIDENGEEQRWIGLKTKTEEIRLYDSSNNFIFKFPQPVAKDAADNIATGHYLIYEDDGILHISVRFSYASLADMTLPIYLDLSLAEGEVAFGQPEYLIGDTLDVWARGSAWSNERTLLYDPSDAVVITWDKPNYADGFTSKYTYTSNEVGTWKAEIEISGYNAKLIDVSSIRLNGTIPVEVKSNEIEEDGKDDVSYDDDLKLKVKFNRTQVQNTVSLGNVTLYISGTVNGAAFTGNSTIRVIENQRIDLDKENEKPEKDNKNKGGKS